MRHQLLTKEIEAKLAEFPLYANEHKTADQTRIIVKFFTPWTKWTWFVTEGEKTGDTFIDPHTGQPTNDYRFFGMVHGDEKELGYFLLSELASVKGPFGLRVERDLHLGFDHTLAELEEKGHI